MSEMKTLTIDGTTYEVVDEAARSVTENANLVEYASDILQTLGGTTISLDGVKIATGSYTGTGTYGADNPCSLTFDFSPVIVFVYASYYWVNGALTGHRKMFGTLVDGQGRMESGNTLWSNRTSDPGDENAYIVEAQISDNIVSWHSVSSTSNQLNEPNYTYSYIAIG